MSDYPGAVDSFRSPDNIPGNSYDPAKTTTIFSEDFSSRSDAIVAIQETLGVNPQGGASSVVARLNGLDTTLGTDPESTYADIAARLDAMQAAIDAGTGTSVPTGVVVPFCGLTIPDGFLLCDGQTVSRTTYADLFALHTTTFLFNSTNGNNDITFADGAATYAIGAYIEGPGIPAGTTIVSGDYNDMHLSANATATQSNATARVSWFPLGNGSTTFAVPDLRNRFIYGSTDGQTVINGIHDLGGIGGSTSHSHPLSNAGQAMVSGEGAGIYTGRVSASFQASRRSGVSSDVADTSTRTVSAPLQGNTDSATTLPPYVTMRYIIKT